MDVWTVGHSNRSEEEFLALLGANRLEKVVDVRRFPGSRRQPHFSREQLSKTLEGAGIEYLHLPELGGRRGAKESPGVDASVGEGWRVAGFANYARYMQTPNFERALGQLEEAAADARTTTMCSEAVWWRCHRQLIADAMLVRGWTVWHVVGPAEPRPHRLTSFAVVDGRKLTYPSEQARLL